MWHVAALCYGAVIGVAAAQWIRADIPGWIAGLAALAIFAVIIKTPQRYMIVLAVAAGACVGLVRGSGDQAWLAVYEPLIGRQVVLSGIVKDDADVAAGGGLRLQIIDVALGERSLPGQIWVTIAKPGNIKRGDRLRLSGTLRAGFGNYAASLARASVLKIKRVPGGDPALELRDGFAAQVRRAIREPEASLGIGFLLGKKSELPPQLLEALKIAGLTHIIVASGYNLTILVRLARRLFAKVSKFLAMFASAGLIGGFMAVTGLSPSMTRAGLVTGLSLWAWYYGRTAWRGARNNNAMESELRVGRCRLAIEFCGVCGRYHRCADYDGVLFRSADCAGDRANFTGNVGGAISNRACFAGGIRAN